MSLHTIKEFQKSSALLLPPLRFYSILVILLFLLLFKYFIYRVKSRIIGVRTSQNPNPTTSLQTNHMYHLALIMVILPDISWNLFDLSVWVFSYIVVGIVRNLFLDIEAEIVEMLNGLLLEKKFETLVVVTQKLSCVTLGVGLLYIILANWYFPHTSIKMNPILMYPTILMSIDSLYMLCNCKIIKSNIVHFFNNNIDSETPRFRLESVYKTLKYSLGIYHFSQLLKIVYRTTMNFNQLSSSVYIISVFKQIYDSFRNLVRCLLAYRTFIDSLNQMNKYLPEAKGDPESECPICQQELQSCRQIKQCGHKFHFRCIFDWVKSKEIPVCPVCRGVIIRSRYIRNRQPEQ